MATHSLTVFQDLLNQDPRVATGDHIVVPEGEVSLNRNISCHSLSDSRVKLLFQVVFIIFPKALESLAK